MTQATEFDCFAAYLKISDQMIEQASNAEIADVARVLALHLAHYRAEHGEIPLRKSFELLLTETLSDEQTGELADGFEVLIAVMKTLSTPAEGRIRLRAGCNSRLSGASRKPKKGPEGDRHRHYRA